MNKSQAVIVVVSFFIISNFLGFFAARNLLSMEEMPETPVANESASSGVYFFLVVGLSTALMLVLYKLKASLVIKAWFALAIFLTLNVFFSTFLEFIYAILATAIFFIIRYKTKRWQIRNLVDICAFAGAGALFGSMIGILPAIILLILLSVYDIVSVFYTKHMVSLAKSGVKSDTFMGISYPKASGISKEEKEVEGDSDKTDNKVKSRTKEEKESKFGVLGGGDIIIPMIVSIALIKKFTILSGVFAVLFSALSLSVLLLKSKKGKFYPAIPPLAFGLFSGFSVWYLLFNLIL